MMSLMCELCGGVGLVVWLNIMQPLPEFIVNGTRLVSIMSRSAFLLLIQQAHQCLILTMNLNIRTLM